MNSPPLISVIMSVYNAEQYLAQAIDSILRQTAKNFEFIIIDDGSRDNSSTIIKKYMREDNRILYIENEKNMGLPYSLNKGIKIAKGEYIARQDADDISLDKRFEIQYNFMEKNQEIDVVGCDNYLIDINGDIFSKNRITDFNARNILRKGLTVFSHGTAFMRAGALRVLGGYNENLFYTQDRDLWCRYSISNKKIARIRQFLYKRRITISKNKIVKKNLCRIITQTFLTAPETRKYVLDTKKISKICKKITKNNLKKNNNYQYLLANYWFFISRQALISNKQRKYVRNCLKRSFLLEDNLFYNSIKIPFFLLSYFPVNLQKINNSQLSKFWDSRKKMLFR